MESYDSKIVYLKVHSFFGPLWYNDSDDILDKGLLRNHLIRIGRVI